MCIKSYVIGIDQDQPGSGLWRCRDSVFPTVLLDGLNYLRSIELLCDVVLVTGSGTDGKEHPAHRVVLASISPYFQYNTQQ